MSSSIHDEKTPDMFSPRLPPPSEESVPSGLPSGYVDPNARTGTTKSAANAEEQVVKDYLASVQALQEQLQGLEKVQESLYSALAGNPEIPAPNPTLLDSANQEALAKVPAQLESLNKLTQVFLGARERLASLMPPELRGQDTETPPMASQSNLAKWFEGTGITGVTRAVQDMAMMLSYQTKQDMKAYLEYRKFMKEARDSYVETARQEGVQKKSMYDVMADTKGKMAMASWIGGSVPMGAGLIGGTATKVGGGSFFGGFGEWTATGQKISQGAVQGFRDSFEQTMHTKQGETEGLTGIYEGQKAVARDQQEICKSVYEKASQNGMQSHERVSRFFEGLTQLISKAYQVGIMTNR